MEAAEYQEKNCRECRFADEAMVGTGEPCCTYPGRLLATPDVCLTRLKNYQYQKEVK